MTNFSRFARTSFKTSFHVFLCSHHDFCIYESNLKLNFNRQCISSTVIPHFSHPVKFSVLLKNVRLASLEFFSCSVYPIIFIAPCRVFISIPKQFKVEICERYHKSHHSAMVLYGSALPHKNVSYRFAQRDMNILLFPVTRDFLTCYVLLLVSGTHGT